MASSAGAGNGIGRLDGKVALITGTTVNWSSSQRMREPHTRQKSQHRLHVSPSHIILTPDHRWKVSSTGLLLSQKDYKLASGASSGIGRGAAVKFAKLGARLALTGRKTQDLEAASQECEAAGSQKPLLLTADLSKEADTVKVVKDTIEKFGQLDVLVNSAGVLAMGSIENTSLQQFDEVFNINVRAIYHLTMLCVPHLVKTKGSIVNVSSVNGIRAFPNVLAYCMSKGALDQFTRCTALELAPKQVRVNSVNPGVIITNVHKRAGMDEDAYQKFLERTKSTHALGRPGEVEEVANTIAFLASDSSSFITGATVPVDGGRHAMCPR